MLASMLGSDALAEVAGPFKDFAEKLGGPDGPVWFSAFKQFLRKENPWVKIREVWKTLTIGGVAKDGLLLRLADGFFVSNWARDIMSKPEFTTLPESVEVQLTRAKVRDLGFKKAPTTSELFARIKEVGDLCPAEVGPHIRLALNDQLNGDWFSVAMEPITDSDGGRGVFSVERYDDGEQWLGAYYARPGYRWDLGSEVVFCLRK